MNGMLCGCGDCSQYHKNGHFGTFFHALQWFLMDDIANDVAKKE